MTRLTRLSLVLAAAATTAQADQVIADDLIVYGTTSNGGICVGQNCVDGQPFGFETILIDTPDPSIRFNDTSNSSSFPSNDWQVGMESASGSFYIQDATGGGNVMTLGASGNAVVLGNGGTLEDGTVSVSGMRVSNVADGVADTDAVTLGQLNAALAAIPSDVVEQNAADLSRLGAEIDAVGAIGSAMSSLQMNPRGTGDHFFSVGMGFYEGTGAIAVGSFHFFNDDRIFVNTGISRATNGVGGTAARIGFTFGR